MNHEAQSIDEALEQRIDYHVLLLYTAKSAEDRRKVCNELNRLVGLRSQERIAQMERERGLR